jgi:hypothetical protein
VSETKASPKHQPSAPRVPDPRRSYDRGVWTDPPAEAANSKPANNDGAAGVAEPNAPTSAGLAGIPTALLVREVERRKQHINALNARRDKLLRQIAALDAAIRELDDDERPRWRHPTKTARTARQPASPRPNHGITLAAALAAAVKPGQVVSPADAAKAVKARGYKTGAAEFGKAVSRTLATHKGFKRKGRGQYERTA